MTVEIPRMMKVMTVPLFPRPLLPQGEKGGS